MSLRIAEVMKMLIMSSNITMLNTWSGDPKSWQAIIIIAWEEVKLSSNMAKTSQDASGPKAFN